MRTRTAPSSRPMTCADLASAELVHEAQLQGLPTISGSPHGPPRASRLDACHRGRGRIVWRGISRAASSDGLRGDDGRWRRSLAMTLRAMAEQPHPEGAALAGRARRKRGSAASARRKTSSVRSSASAGRGSRRGRSCRPGATYSPVQRLEASGSRVLPRPRTGPRRTGRRRGSHRTPPPLTEHRGSLSVTRRPNGAAVLPRSSAQHLAGADARGSPRPARQQRPGLQSPPTDRP